MSVRKVIQIMLAAATVALVLVVVRQLTGPLNFDKTMKQRETVVIAKLKDIRAAQWEFRKQHGRYTTGFDTLELYAPAGTMAKYPEGLAVVPFTDGARFFLDAGMLTTQSGVAVPVFECRAPYKMFLEGLDKQEIVNLIDMYNKSDRYPGIKVGSMEQATNDAGSWE